MVMMMVMCGSALCNRNVKSFIFAQNCQVVSSFNIGISQMWWDPHNNKMFAPTESKREKQKKSNQNATRINLNEHFAKNSIV